jgi:outer membrane protein
MRRIKISIKIIPFLFAAWGTLAAQSVPVNLSVDGAVKYAMENNKTLQNVRNDVLISNAQIKEARGAGLPQVNGTLDYMTNFNYAFELDFGGGGEPVTPVIDFTLLDPGDYQVLSYLAQLSASQGGSEIIIKDQSSATVQFSQLIFSGQYWIGMQLARIGKLITEKSVTLTELDVKEQVINAYHLILVSEELLRIMDENESNLQEVARHTENMFAAGLAEQTDADQIRVNLSQLENSRKAMERNLQLNYNLLKLLLGIEIGDEINLTENLHELLEEIENENLMADNLDILDNPAYQIMMVQEQLGEKNLSMQKWAYSPTLVGFYQYREKLLTSGFDLSPKNSAGLTLSMPIFSGGTRSAQMSKTKIELDKIKRNKELMQEQISIQNDQLLFEIRSAYENYNTQKETVDVAKRLYNSINNKYKQGIVSSLDLTQANSNYLMAENNYVTAIMQLLQSRLKLDKLYNNL